MTEPSDKMDSQRHADEVARKLRKSAEFAEHAEPIVRVVSKAATDLNDVLNAVALRSALLRGRPAGSVTDSDTFRLAGLLDRATELVRELQSYVHHVELQAAIDDVGPEPEERLRHH